MTEHTRTDGLPQTMPAPLDAPAPASGAAPELPGAAPQVLEKSRPRNERMAAAKIECNACPVLCQISPGKTGACDRYANAAGVLVRVDPVVLLRRTLERPDPALVPFAARRADGLGVEVAASAHPLAAHDEIFVTGIGSSTTYPDYKPAPFIVASQAAGVDMVTVVTEGIFSYCSFKVKIDTDRWLGAEQADVRCRARCSSPASAPAPPIPTTNPRHSSSARRSTASTWSPSSPRASSATAA